MNNNIKHLEKLIEIVSLLRGKDGCPWDKEQTHKSLKKYLIEESYEFINAVENDDYENMEEELGDIFLNVLLHCQIAKEVGKFDIYSVAEKEVKKMIDRHPHVFSDKVCNTVEEVNAIWEKSKNKPSNPLKKDLMGLLPTLIKIQKIFKFLDKKNSFEEHFGKLENEKNISSKELSNLSNNDLKLLLFSVLKVFYDKELDLETFLIDEVNRFIASYC